MLMTDPDESETGSRFGVVFRVAVATLIVLAAVAAACIVMVPAGNAVVITRFGDPIRVITEPGLAWKLPEPVEGTMTIDLRLLSTSTGLQDVGTRDGLRVLVQAYVAWQVPNDPERLRQFLRSVRNQPDEAARQLRSFVSAALHITASNFELADLVNVDQNKVRLADFERELSEQVAARMLQGYGIEIRQVGIERLTLPGATLAATVARMRAERETVAAERTSMDCAKPPASGPMPIATPARSSPRRAARRPRPKPMRSRNRRGSMPGPIAVDPGLYTTLRSLEAISKVVGPNTSVVRRTDSPPVPGIDRWTGRRAGSRRSAGCFPPEVKLK